MTDLTYKSAGVDLELYEQAMQKLPRLLRRTHTPRVIDLPGGFAGLFRLDYNTRLFARNYRDPVLVSGTDGVGTKIKVAIAARTFNTIGIDLVAMCVNDCLCLGAEPLFFLDYIALGRDDPELLAALVTGVSDGCLQAEAALLGGETAIMPDLYAPGDFDMAGFAVGVVERKRIVDGRNIRPGDVVVGLASSGLHSNGYSLVRKVVFDAAGLDVGDYVPELEQTVGEVLLEPTRIYARALADLALHYRLKTVIRGMAHITGGGLAGNLERILPEGRRIRIDRRSWKVPGCFTWLQRLGRLDREEMFRVFNMGIGYAIVVNPYFADAIRRRLAGHRIESWVIGEVTAGERGAEYVG
ncbi:MAG TPA: phosphoribosylformylglycinamidine cyclo-ligase [Planctomycetaceae bacterium]|nr:phosphoribosylformylglycinamidine cyclo-ligase [Planctomycetaceae bacterium]